MLELDDILNPVESVTVGNAEGNNQTTASFIDMDTLKDISGNRYRLRDINAGEVFNTYSGVIGSAEVGAQELTTQAAILANHYGFNRIEKTGNKSGNREVIDLVNRAGQNLSDFAVEERLVGANQNTSNEVLTNRMLNKFFDEVTVATDPSQMGNRSREIINQSIRDADVKPTWVESASDEEEYALGKSMYDYDRLKALSDSLEEEKDPEKKQRIQDALYYLKNSKNPYAAVDNRQSDRTIDNVAYNQFTTSLGLGLENTVQSLYGILEMGGEESGWEWLRQKGESGIARSEDETSIAPTTISQFDDIDSIGDSFTWLTNNVAMSIPFMAAAIGGGLLTAPLGGAAVLGTAGALAVGAIPSTILTTGSIWNSMPDGEKSSGLAVLGGFSVGLLDRFGFTGTPKALAKGAAVQNGSMKGLFKEIQLEVVEEMVARSNKLGQTPISAIEATARVAGASKSLLVKMANDFQKDASKKLRDLKLSRDIVKQISIATTREAATETVQTAIEEVAAVYGTSVEINPTAFKEALITSAIVGGVFGTSFAAPSALKQANDRAKILYDVSNADKARSDLDEFALQDQAPGVNARGEQKPPVTVDDVIFEFQTHTATGKEDKSYEDRAKGGQDSRESQGFLKRSAEALMNRPGGLWRAMTVNMIDKVGLKTKDGLRRVSMSRFGSLFAELGINSGLSHQEWIQETRGELTSVVPSADNVAQTLGVNVRTANRMIRQAIEDKAMGIDYTGPKADKVAVILEAYKNAQIELIRKYDLLGLEKESNSLVGDYAILTTRGLEQKAIKNDREGFQKALSKIIAGKDKNANPKSSFNVALANEYIERLLGVNAREAALELNTTYDMTDGSLSPYMNKNLLGSYRDGIANIAKYAGDLKYLGENKSVLTNALNKMVQEGEVSESEANELAADMQDYMEIANGDYGAWDSPWIKSVQDNLILVTFLRGMGFSALASWPELGLTQLGVPEEVAFKHMSAHAKEGAKSLAEYMNFMASSIPGSPIARKIYSKEDIEIMQNDTGDVRNNLLEELGYKGDAGSAVRQQGIEITNWQQTLANIYAKVVGLNNITDYTRGIRAAMSADVVSYYADILANDPNGETNMGREAFTELRSLGVEIPFITSLHNRWKEDPTKSFEDNAEGRAERTRFQKNLKYAALRFVDQAMVNPLPGRVPKGYKLQKLAIFNQFQGYIANFTSKILPRILGQVTSGAPGMTTNAVATSMAMVAAAMLATMLRDEIKYGETTPYLDDYDKFRRVIFSSGLLGSSERLLQGISPLYGSRSAIPAGDNAITRGISSSIDGLLGEAAAYGTVKDIVGGAYELGFGDNRAGVKKALKMLPITGSINQFNDSILDSMNFKGN